MYFGINDGLGWDGVASLEVVHTWLDLLLPLLKSDRTLQLGPRRYSSRVFDLLGALDSLEHVSIAWSPKVWSVKELARFLATDPRARGQRRLKGVEV